MSAPELHQAPEAPGQWRIVAEALAQAQAYRQVDDVDAGARPGGTKPGQARPQNRRGRGRGCPASITRCSGHRASARAPRRRDLPKGRRRSPRGAGGDGASVPFSWPFSRSLEARAGFCRPLGGVQRPDSAPTPGPAGVKGRPEAEREPERSGGSQRPLTPEERPRCTAGAPQRRLHPLRASIFPLQRHRSPCTGSFPASAGIGRASGRAHRRCRRHATGAGGKEASSTPLMTAGGSRRPPPLTVLRRLTVPTERVDRQPSAGGATRCRRSARKAGPDEPSLGRPPGGLAGAPLCQVCSWAEVGLRFSTGPATLRPGRSRISSRR